MEIGCVKSREVQDGDSELIPACELVGGSQILIPPHCRRPCLLLAVAGSFLTFCTQWAGALTQVEVRVKHHSEERCQWLLPLSDLQVSPSPCPHHGSCQDAWLGLTSLGNSSFPVQTQTSEIFSNTMVQPEQLTMKPHAQNPYAGLQHLPFRGNDCQKSQTFKKSL